ncbi:DUF4435 domain-containing protein [Alistipes sp. Z76]|nr:DUF4435 domain-containing protein [Alistipes sp. Z76]NCE67445.1 DUF4435 domain-containing protein [Muribaculaceae bacterium M3]
MKRALAEKLRYEAYVRQRAEQSVSLPAPVDDGRRLVRVFVEGYEDVAFWRGIFDHFRNPYLRFEISVPNREDLPKGKKVLMSMIRSSSEELLLCVDSDFDYLLGDLTPQSAAINSAPFMFHTYTYATENYLCYAPSLHNVCVKATKNDCHIFDFVTFMAEYSRIIYPLFLWYVYSAGVSNESVFTLVDFKNSVRLGFLETDNNGAGTLAWLERNVRRRLSRLEDEHPDMCRNMPAFAERLRAKGVTPETTYLYMHGHTLMDNVVMIMLNAVCDKLRTMSIAKINSSKKTGLPLKNEMSNYINSLRSIRDVLLDNENYTTCPLYENLSRDIEQYLRGVVTRIKAERGE